MEQNLFTSKYKELKERGQMRDALWNDWASEDTSFSERLTRNEMLIAASEDFQDSFNGLIENHELSTEQVLSLENIVFQTCIDPNSEYTHIGHIEVLEPFKDGYEGALEAFGKFQASLLGFGAYRVKGCGGKYVPVRIDHNTDNFSTPGRA